MIKKFILKLIVTVFSFGLLLLTLAILTHCVVAMSFDFKISEDVNTVFMGQSHPECVFNDELIDSSKNLAKGGESYFYTFHKLKEILQRNSGIKLVYLEYSNMMIDKKIDEWTFGYEKMNAFLPWHLPFMDFEEFELIYNENSEGVRATLSTSTRVNLLKIIADNLRIDKDFGSYRAIDRNLIVSQDSSRLETIPSPILNNYSYQSINSLENIRDICNEKGVELRFVRSPTHKYFSFENNDSLLWSIKEKLFPDVKFLDLKNFPLENNDFADESHLNLRGAKKVSSWFNSIQKRNMLEQEDYLNLVSKEIQMLKYAR